MKQTKPEPAQASNLQPRAWIKARRALRVQAKARGISFELNRKRAKRKAKLARSRASVQVPA